MPVGHLLSHGLLAALLLAKVVSAQLEVELPMEAMNGEVEAHALSSRGLMPSEHEMEAAMMPMEAEPVSVEGDGLAWMGRLSANGMTQLHVTLGCLSMVVLLLLVSAARKLGWFTWSFRTEEHKPLLAPVSMCDDPSLAMLAVSGVRNACHCLRDGVKLCDDMPRLVIESFDSEDPSTAATPASSFAVTTLNIHCPAHKRIGNGQRESSDESLFLPRNARILDLVLKEPPAVICMQEFWMCSDKIRSLYQAVLGPAGYNMYMAPRANCRGDGLLTMVARDAFAVLDNRNVSYNDCGDRVAHVLHLRNKGLPIGEGDFLMVNTHLMFPHDQDAELIRLRQCAKLLSYIRSYVEKYQLSHLPVVICGDWNGEPDGAVARFMQSQGFMSTFDEHRQGSQRWVSHLNHHAQAVGVDYIWVLNPSARSGSLTANWQQMVCACIMAQLAHHGITNQQQAFAHFDKQGKGYFTPAELVEGINQLHMTGEQGIGLLENEILEVAQFLDINGDGVIDPEELLQRLDLASSLPLLKYTNGDVVEFLMAYCATHAGLPLPAEAGPDLEVVEATLPPSFAAGVWPEGFEQEISDHAPLTAVFNFAKRPARQQKLVDSFKVKVVEQLVVE